jgi:hypothetical protein
MTDEKLDALIARAMRRDHSQPGEKDAVAGILKTLAATRLPAQRKSIRWWPAPLLDIDLAPSWPRIAAFACVVALGVAIGLVSPDIGILDNAVTVSAAADIDLNMFEPELLTGARP